MGLGQLFTTPGFDPNAGPGPAAAPTPARGSSGNTSAGGSTARRPGIPSGTVGSVLTDGAPGKSLLGQ